jgi:hypothetical protein
VTGYDYPGDTSSCTPTLSTLLCLRKGDVYGMKACGYKVVWGMLLILGTVACVFSSPKCQEPGDTSLTTGSPCAPPCWQGVVPGETSEAEAKEILERLPYVRDLGWGIYTEEATWSNPCLRTSEFRASSGVPVNRIAFEGGLVQMIRVNIDHHLTVGELIARYGPPDKIVPSVVGDGGGVIYFGVDMFYPGEGLVVEAASLERPGDLSDISVPSVDAEMAVKTVTYFSPTSMEDIVAGRSSAFYPRREYIAEHQQDWPGLTH